MSAALLLLGTGDALHVAVVVVDPDQCDVVRHLQAMLVDVHRLLVRDEYLGDFTITLRCICLVLDEQVALVLDDFFEQRHTLRHR